MIVWRLRLRPGAEPNKPTSYSTGGASPRWLQRPFSGLSWSADSKRLAFSSDMADGQFHVYVLTLRGGETTRLDDTRSEWFQWVAWCPQ